jgi:hypothetical protein
VAKQIPPGPTSLMNHIGRKLAPAGDI